MSDNRPMVDRAEMLDAATRLLGEQELALYLGVEAEQLRRYGMGIDEVPQLLEAMSGVLAQLRRPVTL